MNEDHCSGMEDVCVPKTVFSNLYTELSLIK